MIEPKEITVNGKPFIISKFPAMKGCEILAGCSEMYSYKDGTYPAHEKLRLQILEYVAIPSKTPGLAPTWLNNKAIIDGNLTTHDVLALEAEMRDYNFGFLIDGSTSTS